MFVHVNTASAQFMPGSVVNETAQSELEVDYQEGRSVGRKVL
jgi:hypothetical protein